MIVYKFGGASVKDAYGIKNLLNIVSKNSGDLVIVVSAFGKTTNALEEILELSFNDSLGCQHKFELLKSLHNEILNNLFLDKNHRIFGEINEEFGHLYKIIYQEEFDSYDKKYDQIISFGEILSTKIVSAYLNYNNLLCKWVDIRKVFVTNETFREAKIYMDLTKVECKAAFNFEQCSIFLTQGFIGSSKDGYTTTLGREGSDYTAAVLGNLLDAERVVVWKDVDGILNADPQYFEGAEKLARISYQEAVELAYFGAKVIHPKTLKPLHNKKIPLFVRSFLNLEDEGTEINNFENYDQDLPIYILKKNQMLISLFPKDLSFVIEDELSKIFRYLSEHRIKVNLIQNSAISFSFCVDNANKKVRELVERLQEDYKVLYNDQLELLTIRHYSNDAIEKTTKGRKIYIEQRSRHTAHFVIK